MRFNHSHVPHRSPTMRPNGTFFLPPSLYYSSLFFQNGASSDLTSVGEVRSIKRRNLYLLGWLNGLLISLGLVDEREYKSNALLKPLVDHEVLQQSTRSWDGFWFFKILNTFYKITLLHWQDTKWNTNSTEAFVITVILFI